MTEAMPVEAGAEAPTTLGRLLASEDAAVAELTPPTPLEVEATVSAEVEALHELPLEGLVEAEANLRVLLAEQDDVGTVDTGHRALHDLAAESLHRLVPEVHLADD